jgi:mono/diheme cytochrome c family protein
MPGAGAPRRRVALALALVLGGAPLAPAATTVERGAYLAAAAGCVGCHTADREGAPPFAGGRALESPFGTFHSPNITPDPETGIGRWTDAQFLAALHDGERPDGSAYFPAFPYVAYRGMSADDALAIKAWLFTQPAVRQANLPHDLPWYLRTRLAARAWRWLFFNPGRFAPEPARGTAWNRGAYLVRHLGHCGECHTPRNALGALRGDAELAGNASGPEDRDVPNITPHAEAGIGDWTAGDIETFLEIGMYPDGDFAGSGMGQVIDENTSRLTAEDRRAIVTYLQNLPPQAQASSPD